MKKTNFLKFALTLIMAFVITGVFAQSTNVPGAIGNYATGSPTYVTEGTTVPLWAEPDGYYHPSYDPDVANSLTAGFTWTWTELVTSDITFSNNNPAIPPYTNDDNYTTISGLLVANSPYTINVVEVAPDALGGCSGAATSLTINVVAQPSFEINGGDATYSFCEGGAFPANINTTIAGGWQAYHLAWNLEIATLDDASAKEFWYDDELGTTQFGVLTYAPSYTQTTGGFDGSQNAPTAAYDIMTVGSFLAINNGTRDAVTVYTYTLLSVNDRASRFGDFITLNGVDGDASAFTDYPALAAGDQVIITVYPAPVTGPIFHISNTWAN